MLSGIVEAMDTQGINCDTNKIESCTVKFILSTSGLRKVAANILATVDSPNIIIWYSGEDGLTKRSKEFYETNLNSILKQLYIPLNKRKPYSLFLYDLSAWRGLKV